MTAELLTSLGAALEISTAVAPQYFLLLAGSGHFCHSVGKALGKPVFRIILARELCLSVSFLVRARACMTPA